MKQITSIVVCTLLIYIIFDFKDQLAQKSTVSKIDQIFNTETSKIKPIDIKNNLSQYSNKQKEKFLKQINHQLFSTQQISQITPLLELQIAILNDLDAPKSQKIQRFYKEISEDLKFFQTKRSDQKQADFLLFFTNQYKVINSSL